MHFSALVSGVCVLGGLVLSQLVSTCLNCISLCRLPMGDVTLSGKRGEVEVRGRRVRGGEEETHVVVRYNGLKNIFFLKKKNLVLIDLLH